MAPGGSRLGLWFGLALCAATTRPAFAQVGSEARDAAAAENAVTPPKLSKFAQAAYPAEAQAKGVEAEVVLALDIDAQGKVSAAEVVEPAGHGFDEAARAAALQFEFEPARRNGRPVKSRILYRYAFRFETRPEEPAQPAPSSISGRVLAESGEMAVVGAVVRLERRPKVSTEKPELVAERVTRADGNFDFPDLPAGDYRLTISAEGLLPFESDETLQREERLFATYRLEAPNPEQGLNIVVRGTRPRREVTRRPLARRELSRIPGTSGDALRAIQNLPGVARPPSLSGLLLVRGNGEMTTPIFVDGLWLPNVYHFGGLSSVIPTEMIDELNFYPGNFSVRYGRALAGVVDVHLRETRDDGRYHGLLQLDMVDVRGVLEGPIPGLDGWNFIAGVRRSHVDTWLAPLLEDRDTQIKAAPVYYDYQLLADTRPTPRSYLRLGLLGADDRFRVIDSSSATGGEIETIDSTWGLGAIYNVSLDERLSLDLSLTMARLHQRFSLSTILADTVAYGTIARGEFEWAMWDRAKLRFGYDVLVAPYSVNGQLPDDPGPSAPQVGSFVTTPVRRFDKSDVFLQPAVYAEFELSPNARTEVVSGVRLDYTHDTGRYDVSPRLSARYELVSGFPSTALKAGTGLFHQPPGLAEVVLSEEQSLRSLRSFQNSLGVEQELTEQVELSVEGFYNLLDNLVSRRADENGVLRYDNSGKGRILGAEAMLRYRADERFFGWLSYTLSRSERTWIPGEPSRLFALDQTHILTALASLELGRGWEIGARFRYVSGNLYTPCEGGIFSSIATEYLCLNGPINSERLPPFHQLDVRVDKRWVFSGFTLGAYLDLINAYNRTNPDFIEYNYDYTESQPQTGSLPIVPSLGVRGEF
jgi:TonB family protein